ncbi:hypothetical protein SAMN05216364_100622 [Porphyromonadaceae bacterium KHP3R9]|nr:hypothetical protein SAMN05216364_100622 [Porphyromonadaceae bacterium KHP3R9]
MHRRNYFKSLKMKPVKLEMLFDDKTDNGFKSVGDNITSTKDKLKLLIEVQKSYIENIKSTLENTKKSFSASTNVEETKKLSVSIVEVEKELKDAEFALALLEKGMEESGDEAGTLRTRIMNLKNDMAKMTEGTDEYREAMQRLGEMQDRYGDITQQGRVLADDEKNIRATADAIAGLSGAMSAGVGIASLFGAEQEKLQQIQTRLQAVMATTIGLQQVAQTLNKDSYFSIVLLQGAKKKWAAAQTVLNTQLGIGVGLSKALMVSGVGLLLAGIAALVVVYDKWKKKQAEINALKQEYIDLEVDTVKAMAADKVKMEQLHKIASDQTKTLELRNKAIERIKTLMPDYNGQINREGVLIDNANTAMKNYLVTLYKVEKAKKLFASIEEDQGTLDAMQKEGSKPLTFWESMWIGLERTFSRSAGDQTMNDLINRNTQRWVDGMDKLRENIQEKNKELESLIDDKTIFKSIFGEDTGGGADSSTSTPENRLSEQRLDALRRINEKRIALMAEGEEKRKSQAKQEYENTLVEIARDKAAREKHLQELVKAKIPVSQQEVEAISAQAQQEALLAKQQYDAKIRQIDTETANQNKAIQTELRLNFETRLNQQLADSDAYYNDLLSKAKGSIALIAQIENARIQSRKQITHEAQLREIELENELALRKQEIDDRQVILAVDRQEKLLQIELEGQQKKLAKLEEMQRDGMDVEEDIKLVRSEIDKLSASLKRIPTDRVKEIGGHLKNWLSTLSGIGGELGESLSALADGVDGVTAAFDKEATTTDHVGNAISGLVKLYQMASAQLEENRQKQQEWNDKIEEAAHKARMLRIEELEYQQSNIFGVENPYAKAIAGANQYRQSMTELNDSLNKLAEGQIQVGTKKVVSGKNIATGAAAGATAGAAIGSVIPVIGTALGGLIGGALGGLFGATKKKVVPVFESLAQKFGSILKDGTETFELNPAILENYSKLDDATKKLVDNWEQIREKALEAQEQMRQTFSDLAGDIGGSLSDALVNSFRNNDLYAAVDVFEDKLTSTIENIIAQLVFSAHFQKMFDELQQRMEDSFDAGGDGDIVDDIVWFSKNYKDKIAAYGKSMEEVREEMKRQGFDLFEPEETGRTAASKGISGLSQDQGNKLEGQLTNVQARLMNIDKNVIDMANFLFRIFDPINRIADNTDRLEAIEDSMEEVKEGIGKMVREGINLKR